MGSARESGSVYYPRAGSVSNEKDARAFPAPAHRFPSMKPKLPRGTLYRLWADSKNWNDGHYFCADDP